MLSLLHLPLALLVTSASTRVPSQPLYARRHGPAACIAPSAGEAAAGGDEKAVMQQQPLGQRAPHVTSQPENGHSFRSAEEQVHRGQPKFSLHFLKCCFAIHRDDAIKSLNKQIWVGLVP